MAQTIIALPSLPWRASAFELLRGDEGIGLIGGAEVIVVNQVALWGQEYSFAPRDEEEFRILNSRLTQLAKFGNVFEATPPAYLLSSGYAGADPVVMGVGQLGNTLTCDGVTASTLIVQEGDYIRAANQVLLQTADATSNGSSVVTFNFEPALRKAPTDDTTVELNTPKARFRFVNPRHRVSFDVMGFRTTELLAIESYEP